MSIPFTQFLMPDGRRVRVTINRPADIEAQAKAILDVGYSFEIEMLTTGAIHMEAYRDSDESSLGQQLCANGPAVLVAVDRMVTEAFIELNKGGC